MQRPLLPIVASAALIFGVYATFVQFAPLRIASGQNQNDTNLIRAQDYLAAPDAATVLVGSSLTFRLPAAALGPLSANLAIAGGAPATGLTLIQKAATHPELVLVEVNLLQHGADEAMVEALLRFPERPLRKHLRVFRTGYDPVNLVWRGMAAAMHKADFDPPPSLEVTRRLIEIQQREKSQLPDMNALRQNLTQASSLVAALRARGIRVGFFEMPVDPSLSDLPTNVAVRREALRVFPRDRFCWLNLVVPGGAHTVDGVHLTAEDAVFVARQIANQRGACLKP